MEEKTNNTDIRATNNETEKDFNENVKVLKHQKHIEQQELMAEHEAIERNTRLNNETL